MMSPGSRDLSAVFNAHGAYETTSPPVGYEQFLEELRLLRDIYSATDQVAQGQGMCHECALVMILSALGCRPSLERSTDNRAR